MLSELWGNVLWVVCNMCNGKKNPIMQITLKDDPVEHTSEHNSLFILVCNVISILDSR
jgi:hypothetical protein